MRIYNNFYVFYEKRNIQWCRLPQSVRRRGARVLGCIEGGSGEPRRDDGGILGASREAVGSRGEMAVGDAGEKQI
jgi:hypothetical protein